MQGRLRTLHAGFCGRNSLFDLFHMCVKILQTLQTNIIVQTGVNIGIKGGSFIVDRFIERKMDPEKSPF